MNRIFLTLVCISFFQLHGMEKKRTVSLNDVPADVLAVYLVPRLIPDFCIFNKTNVNEEELYVAVKSWKDLNNIALINKHFYNAVKFKCTLYDPLTKNIADNSKTYSLFKLLQCFKFSQPVTVTFEKEKEWWQFEKEESMEVNVRCSLLNVNSSIVMDINCSAASEYFPIKFNNPYMKKDSIKMSDSLKQFFDLMNSLKNHAKSIGYGEKNAKEIFTMYIFCSKRAIAVQDAILLCKLLQKFDFSHKKKDSDLIEKIKNLF